MNQTLAYQALAMLARLFRYGRLSYHWWRFRELSRTWNAQPRFPSIRW